MANLSLPCTFMAVFMHVETCRTVQESHHRQSRMLGKVGVKLFRCKGHDCHGVPASQHTHILGFVFQTSMISPSRPRATLMWVHVLNFDLYMILIRQSMLILMLIDNPCLNNKKSPWSSIKKSMIGFL